MLLIVIIGNKAMIMIIVKVVNLFEILQIEVIHAFGIIKRCAAEVNEEFGLQSDTADLIISAADEVCA